MHDWRRIGGRQIPAWREIRRRSGGMPKAILISLTSEERRARPHMQRLFYRFGRASPSWGNLWREMSWHGLKCEAPRLLMRRLSRSKRIFLDVVVYNISQRSVRLGLANLGQIFNLYFMVKK